MLDVRQRQAAGPCNVKMLDVRQRQAAGRYFITHTFRPFTFHSNPYTHLLHFLPLKIDILLFSFQSDHLSSHRLWDPNGTVVLFLLAA